ncbi:hypothetical protein RJ641_027689 [Dillenia turbinata]|uniref:Uncharacterized protein n=1 Tax=Dillenia turbinata TaxID=194707 RepID=A0AAN8WAJ7_9MAGN
MKRVAFPWISIVVLFAVLSISASESVLTPEGGDCTQLLSNAGLNGKSTRQDPKDSETRNLEENETIHLTTTNHKGRGASMYRYTPKGHKSSANSILAKTSFAGSLGLFIFAIVI